jgi:hypothetical protein
MDDRMVRLADGLRGWRRTYGSSDDTAEARTALREFVTANEPLIREALDTVGEMPMERMLELLHEHPELNVPEGVVVPYAAGLIDALGRPDDEFFVIDVDDHVNVLKRVVEYAQYA